MEQFKETWNLVFTWFGNGKKMIAGALFLLTGMIMQSFSVKTLAHFPFFLIMAGLMCFVNALVSRMASCNINILLSLIVNLAAVEIGFALTSYYIVNGGVDSLAVGTAWFFCILAAWILQSALLHVDGWPGRLGLAALHVILSAVAVLAALFLPILLSVVIG